MHGKEHYRCEVTYGMRLGRCQHASCPSALQASFKDFLHMLHKVSFAPMVLIPAQA